MAKKVFISYRHQQADWVRTTLYPVLTAGGAEVVVDYQDFAAGEALRRQMKAKQARADIQLLLFTPEYFTSPYCVEEMKRAIAMDPTFSKGVVLPVIFEKCRNGDMPSEIKKHQPIHVDLTGDRQLDAHAWGRIMECCEADLGTSVSNWVTSFRRTAEALKRQKSVNLLVKGEKTKWREFMAEVKRVVPELGIVDIESGKTVTRQGLVSEILAAVAAHRARVPQGNDLRELERILEAQKPALLALEHFDLVAQRHHYKDLFASLRHLVMEKRQLTLLVQSRAAFATLLPKNHALSYLEMETLELGDQH